MKTAKDILSEKGFQIIAVPPDSTLCEALKKMVKHNIGAIAIREDEQEPRGIWTERDLMRQTYEPNFDPKTAKIGDYMTKELKKVDASASIYKMLEMFLGLRLRHVFVTENEKTIGLLSTGDVIQAALHEKDRELKELNEMVSWEYYENWRWT